MLNNLLIVSKRLLIIGMLAAVFCVSAGMVIYLTLRGRIVEVPNVIGKTRQEAETELLTYGLRIKEEPNKASSDKYPADVIINQIPAAGKEVKTGQQVRVIVSLGNQPVQKIKQ